MRDRFFAIVGALLVLLLVVLCGCEDQTRPSATSDDASSRPVPPSVETIPDSLLVDSVAVALNRFRAARGPTSEDSATVRRWADSLVADGNAIRSARPERSRAYLRLGLRVHRSVSDNGAVGAILGDIGVTYFFESHYEKAITRFREALQVSRQTGNTVEVAANLNNIGLIHRIQGRYEQALARYQASLTVERELGNRRGVASSLNNIGSVHLSRARYDEALEHYRKALAMQRELGYKSGIADILNNIGIIHREQGRYESALARYRESLAIKREQSDERGMAHTINNIGLVYTDQGRSGIALRQFRRALALNRDIGRRQGVVYNLDNIGDVHLDKGQLRAATDTLDRAVQLAEELRLGATSAEARRSMLAAQIESYRSLTTTHVRAGRSDAALRSLERARARLLAERLSDTAGDDTTFAVPRSPKLRRTLGPDEAALLYTNVGSQRPLTVLVATRDTVVARELAESRFQVGIERAYADRLRRVRRNRGPLTPVVDGERSPRQDASLAAAIRLYRHNLTRQAADTVQAELARRFHDLLLAPVDEVLDTRDALIVVPTGTLGYLPFETLRDATGQYLVERMHVRYAQSLTVLRHLQRRSYGASRRPLLAIGGASYGGANNGGDGPLLADARRGSTRVSTEKQASAVFRSAERRIEEGRSPRPAYRRLGYEQWPPLFGTKLEVQKLGRAIGAGSSLLTGTAASEERIREMNEAGTLSEFRRVHFATHGIAVPEAPKLSTLVLSQTQAPDSLAARDGYLTMQEISSLDLHADVAVLSACRTGLGRIVAGEGVVNLSHAFLRAGANATLVSQWRVLDWSTQQFMTAVYRRAEAEGTTFAEAATHVKRRFIQGQFGERNTDPLRWAPFVYYGRE